MAPATGIPGGSRADDDGRECDAQFDEGHIDLADAEQEADGHHENEAQRHQPQGAAAQHEGEHAHRHHGEDVVDAADGVLEAMHEAGGFAMAGMGERRRRQRDEKKGQKGAGAHREYLLERDPPSRVRAKHATAGLLAPSLLPPPSQRKPVAPGGSDQPDTVAGAAPVCPPQGPGFPFHAGFSPTHRQGRFVAGCVIKINDDGRANVA
jgi:hypothetical protein